MTNSGSKRIFDVSLVLLLSPLWMLALGLLALTAAIGHGRPILFRQWRASLDGEPFQILKLRTLTNEPEEGLRRPTRVGSWLRRRGLDEVPQVLNVLAGSMSLVGPRPLTFSDLTRLGALYPPFLGRLSARPGITGPAQVCQAQGVLATAELELAYAESRTLWLDGVLLAQTVWINIVGKRRGAQSSARWLAQTGQGGLDATALARETVKGLLAPRRFIPIVLVCAPMLYAQGRFSRTPSALVLGLLMCAAFILIAPVSFRLLLPEGVSKADSWLRLLLYIGLGSGVVLLLGSAVPAVLGVGVTFLTTRISLLITLGLFLVGGWGLARDVDFEHRLQRERARSDRLAAEAERAQLLALRAQLDPHFLFNTLNAIAEWCREDGVVAEQAVLQLSRMLRSILEGIQSQAWSLEKELSLVTTLFSLHRLRDEALFDLVCQVDDTLLGTPVPPLSLLPLAENAVKHGPAAGSRGTIELHVERRGEALVVLLENPGIFAGPRVGGEGLPQLRRRLRLAYGGKAELTVQAQGSRTRAQWVVPLSGPDSEVQA